MNDLLVCCIIHRRDRIVQSIQLLFQLPEFLFVFLNGTQDDLCCSSLFQVCHQVGVCLFQSVDPILYGVGLSALHQFSERKLLVDCLDDLWLVGRLKETVLHCVKHKRCQLVCPHAGDAAVTASSVLQVLVPVAVVDVAGERLAALRTACEAVEGVVVLAGSAGCPPAVLCQLLLDFVEECRLDDRRHPVRDLYGIRLDLVGVSVSVAVLGSCAVVGVSALVLLVRQDGVDGGV